MKGSSEQRCEKFKKKKKGKKKRRVFHELRIDWDQASVENTSFTSSSSSSDGEHEQKASSKRGRKIFFQKRKKKKRHRGRQKWKKKNRVDKREGARGAEYASVLSGPCVQQRAANAMLDRSEAAAPFHSFFVPLYFDPQHGYIFTFDPTHSPFVWIWTNHGWIEQSHLFPEEECCPIDDGTSRSPAVVLSSAL